MDKVFFPEHIETDDLVLKKHELALAKTMFDYVEKDRERLSKFLPWVDFTKTVLDEQNFITMTHKEWDSFEHFDYGIFKKCSNTYMGNIGVHTISWNHRRCELGYWILGDFEGHGYISKSVQAIEEVCFELGFHRIEIRCAANNEKSSSVPKRVGYEFEGTLKQNMFDRGEFVDTLVFAKLARD